MEGESGPKKSVVLPGRIPANRHRSAAVQIAECKLQSEFCILPLAISIA
jgi:hypothetical protein